VPENSYSEIRFVTVPQIETHPDRLSAVGTFFGMTPAPVRGCRFLEIGCGDGSNLIPMAYAMPESHFIGVDLAGPPIATGCQTIASLDLGNITLIQGDLRDIDSAYGDFDYIAAPGVYSWVPADVRDRLVAVCAERLTPQGVAYINYNAYPGKHVRQMFREMLQYHTRNSRSAEERIEQAHGLLRFLKQGRGLNAPWQALVNHEATMLLERSTGGLFHDELEDVNDPVYFHQFAAHAAKHGLQYLSEADVAETFDQQDLFGWLGGDWLEREQYMDFLCFRRFRQTLLCRQDVQLHRPPDPDTIRLLRFSAPCKKVGDGETEGLRGIRLGDLHERVQRVTSALGDAYPIPLAFDELITHAGSAATLRQILFQLVTSGYADIHTFDFPCERAVTAKPKASSLARRQAAASSHVVSARHQLLELDDIGRHLALLMDGSRDHEQLVHDLAAIAGAPSEEKIREHLPYRLGWMARRGLLERTAG